MDSSVVLRAADLRSGEQAAQASNMKMDHSNKDASRRPQSEQNNLNFRKCKSSVDVCFSSVVEAAMAWPEGASLNNTSP